MQAELHDAYPKYRWYPDMLVNATHSAENLAYDLHHHVTTHVAAARDHTVSYIKLIILQNGLGVYDATDDEVNRLVDNTDPWPASYILADIISRRAQVGWTTHGHSAVDVNIYASNPKHAKALIGNHENTEIGEFIRDYLDVDLDAVTKELVKQQAFLSPGKPVDDSNTLADTDHYQGDFKRSLGCNCGSH